MPGNEKFIEEKLIMQFLREDFPDFPGGKLIKSESPDFILKSSRKNSIGIEMTRLHEQMNQHTGNSSKTNQLIGELLSKTKKHFEQKYKTLLYVKCFFNTEKLPTPGEIEFYTRFLSVYISKSLEGHDLKKYFQISIENGLPEMIDYMQIIHYPGTDISFWDYGRSFLLFDLQKQMIQENIRKKEEKLGLYKKNRFDQYWLILVTMKLNTGKNFNVFNKLDEWAFRSTFDSILLYELFEQKVYKLNLG